MEASVRESIGVAYRRRSMFVQAVPHLQRSLEIRRERFGDNHRETARSNVAVANLRFEYEGDINEALDLLRRAYDCYSTHAMLDTDAEAWLQLDIGIVCLAGDRLTEAERAFERCRELLARYRGPDHPDISRPVRGLAMVALRRGDHENAERLGRQAIALSAGEGETYIGARAEQVLALVLLETDRLDEASELLDRTGAEFAGTVGARHIRIAERYAILSELHLQQGEFQPAELISAHCEAMRRQILHEDHWEILQARLLHQRALIGLGQAGDVEQELLVISGEAERLLGSDHPLTIEIAEARLDCARALGDDSLAAIRAERLVRMQDRRASRLQLVSPVDHDEGNE